MPMFGANRSVSSNYLIAMCGPCLWKLNRFSHRIGGPPGLQKTLNSWKKCIGGSNSRLPMRSTEIQRMHLWHSCWWLWWILGTITGPGSCCMGPECWRKYMATLGPASLKKFKGCISGCAYQETCQVYSGGHTAQVPCWPGTDSHSVWKPCWAPH